MSLGTPRRLGRALAGLALALAAGLGTAQPATDCPPAAQPPTAEQVSQGMRQARDRGFLWRIEKDGRRSHLYGTLHVARHEWMFPGPKVVAALRASDVIALEIDLLDAEQQRRLAAAMAAEGTRPMPAALRERLARLAERECLEWQRVEGLAPESQVAVLTAMTARRDGLDPAYGIDLVLAGLGRGMRTPVVSLETPEIQAAALRSPDPAGRDTAIANSLDALETGRARPMMQRMAQVWADADHDALANFHTWCECLRDDTERAAMKRLLDDRHPGIVEAIDALHRGGQRVFAAVGSLHFTGAQALQVLLARRGYRVERIVLSPP